MGGCAAEEACAVIGDHGNSGDAQAEAAGEDDFRYGRHADQCGTKQFGGADFGGGFEARAGEPVIETIGKGDTGFRGGGS